MKNSRQRIEKDFRVGSIRTVILDGDPKVMRVKHWLGGDKITFDLTCGISDNPIMVDLSIGYVMDNYVSGCCEELLCADNEQRVNNVQKAIRSLDIYQFERVEHYLNELGKLTT